MSQPKHQLFNDIDGSNIIQSLASMKSIVKNILQYKYTDSNYPSLQ